MRPHTPPPSVKLARGATQPPGVRDRPSAQPPRRQNAHLPPLSATPARAQAETQHAGSPTSPRLTHPAARVPTPSAQPPTRGARRGRSAARLWFPTTPSPSSSCAPSSAHAPAFTPCARVAPWPLPRERLPAAKKAPLPTCPPLPLAAICWPAFLAARPRPQINFNAARRRYRTRSPTPPPAPLTRARAHAARARTLYTWKTARAGPWGPRWTYSGAKRAGTHGGEPRLERHRAASGGARAAAALARGVQGAGVRPLLWRGAA